MKLHFVQERVENAKMLCKTRKKRKKEKSSSAIGNLNQVTG